MNIEPRTLPAEQRLGQLEPVAYFDGAMPTGVSVSHQGRIFVNFPRWGDDVDFTVAEIRGGQPVPYPDLDTNHATSRDASGALVSVQSIVVDPVDRLWILDTGSPLFKPTEYGGPRLLCVDLAADKVIKTILFPQDVALPTSYLNDVRFDLRRGREGMAFITDSADQGSNGLLVVDLDTGESWRRLHDHPSTKAEDPRRFVPIIEGRPLLKHGEDGTAEPYIQMGADGIAIGADGARLYYCPLAGHQLYSVATDALCDRSLDDDAVALTIVDEGDKGAPATAWNPTRPATSTPRITNTTPSCAAIRAAHGRRSRTIRACCGRTHSRSPPTATYTSPPISCTVRCSFRTAKICGKNLTRCFASTSLPSPCCSVDVGWTRHMSENLIQ